MTHVKYLNLKLHIFQYFSIDRINHFALYSSCKHWPNSANLFVRCLDCLLIGLETEKTHVSLIHVFSHTAIACVIVLPVAFLLCELSHSAILCLIDCLMNLQISKQLIAGWILTIVLIVLTYWIEDIPPKFTEFFEGDLALSYSVHDTVPYKTVRYWADCLDTNM